MLSSNFLLAPKVVISAIYTVLTTVACHCSTTLINSFTWHPNISHYSDAVYLPYCPRDFPGTGGGEQGPGDGGGRHQDYLGEIRRIENIRSRDRGTRGKPFKNFSLCIYSILEIYACCNISIVMYCYLFCVYWSIKTTPYCSITNIKNVVFPFRMSTMQIFLIHIQPSKMNL